MRGADDDDARRRQPRVHERFAIGGGLDAADAGDETACNIGLSCVRSRANLADAVAQAGAHDERLAIDARGGKPRDEAATTLAVEPLHEDANLTTARQTDAPRGFIFDAEAQGAWWPTFKRLQSFGNDFAFDAAAGYRACETTIRGNGHLAADGNRCGTPGFDDGRERHATVARKAGLKQTDDVGGRMGGCCVRHVNSNSRTLATDIRRCRPRCQGCRITRLGGPATASTCRDRFGRRTRYSPADMDWKW